MGSGVDARAIPPGMSSLATSPTATSHAFEDGTQLRAAQRPMLQQPSGYGLNLTPPIDDDATCCRLKAVDEVPCTSATTDTEGPGHVQRDRRVAALGGSSRPEWRCTSADNPLTNNARPGEDHVVDEKGVALRRHPSHSRRKRTIEPCHGARWEEVGARTLFLAVVDASFDAHESNRDSKAEGHDAM
jgi:hypothetical protein